MAASESYSENLFSHVAKGILEVLGISKANTSAYKLFRIWPFLASIGI